MTPERVIINYFATAGLWTLAAALIWGVNTLFLLDAGLDIFGVFIANASFTVGSVLFEIPTGVLADTRGRRASFLLSVAILFATTLAYVAVAEYGGGLAAFCIVSIFMGLGFTFYSGAVEAWLVDALKATDYKGSLDRVFARGSMIVGAAMLIGAVAGGFLGGLNLSFPFIARAALLVIVFALAFWGMHDVGFTPRTIQMAQLPQEIRTVARSSISFGWGNRSVRLLMAVSFIQFGFLSWGFYAWQPYFLELLGRDAIWVAGVVAALISLSMIAGNMMVDWFSRFCGRRTTMLFWAGAIQTVAAMGVGFAGDFWLAVLCLTIVTGAMGVTGPVKQAYLHQLIPTEQRATVISFDSMMGSAGGIVGQSGLGFLSRARSISDGYVMGGLVTIFALPVVFFLRNLGEEGDKFAGEKAGAKSTCAPQGAPTISQMDGSAV